MSEKGDRCLVCDFDICQVHYSINSCSKCSIFFRRSKKNNRNYSCKRLSKDCVISHYSKNSMCRYCRLKKCIDSGMIWKNNDLKFNDGTPVMAKKTSAIDMASQEEADAEESCLRKSIASTFSKDIRISGMHIHYDKSHLLTKIKNIIRGPYKPIPNVSNPPILQSLAYGLSELLAELNRTRKEEVVITKTLDFKKYVIFHEKSAILLAKALTHSIDYCQHSDRDRALLFNSVWPVFFNFERIWSSIFVFGSQNRNIIFFDDTQAFDEQFASLSEQDLPAESVKEMFQLFGSCNEFLLKSLYLPLKELVVEEDPIEFAYLIYQFMYGINELEELSPSGREIQKKVMKCISNELHNHYTFTKNLDNYSYRLSEIMKTGSRALTYVRMKSEVILAARIFRLMDSTSLYFEKMDLSHPGLIYLMQ